eukprot:1152218-Pelagomonas_calceolata.AAC.3
MARLVEGMGSMDSPTHSQNICVESDLSALELFAHFTLPGWSCAASYFFFTSPTAGRARSDQDTIMAAEGVSSLIRNAGVKEVGRYNT